LDARLQGIDRVKIRQGLGDKGIEMGANKVIVAGEDYGGDQGGDQNGAIPKQDAGVDGLEKAGREAPVLRWLGS
jgi:hypothetical protein